MKGFPKEKHMKIRRIRENDTENFFQMMCRLDEETEYMMYEPGERQRTIKDLSRLKAFIHAAASGYDFLIVAENDNVLSAYNLSKSEYNVTAETPSAALSSNGSNSFTNNYSTVEF